MMQNIPSRKSEPIKIIVADDHSIFVEGLQSVFKKQTDMNIIAEASNGKQLLELVERYRPDVILIDIKMPEMNGIEATHKLKLKFPKLPVIAITMYEEDHYIVDMLEAGASGFLLKNAHKDEIFKAVRAVHCGDVYYCSSTSLKLVKLIVNSKFNPYKPQKKPLFNEKELEVIKLICQEYSSKEIADHIFTTPKYVERMRERIEEKIGAKNMAGIVVYAIRNRIFTLD